MTPAQHYSEAEEHLAAAAAIEPGGHEDSQSAWHQRQAQVHALLALAAGPPGVEPYAAAVWGEEPPKMRESINPASSSPHGGRAGHASSPRPPRYAGSHDQSRYSNCWRPGVTSCWQLPASAYP